MNDRPLSKIPDQAAIRVFDPSIDDVSEITRLLHATYRPLAEAGMRYVASHQDDARTLTRANMGECLVALLNGAVVGTVTLSETENTRGTPWYGFTWKPGMATQPKSCGSRSNSVRNLA